MFAPPGAFAPGGARFVLRRSHMLNLYCRVRSILGDERGQGLVEYSLILMLVALVVIVMLTGIGGTLNNNYSSVNSCLNPPSGG